jgi:hypothetical protein
MPDNKTKVSFEDYRRAMEEMAENDQKQMGGVMRSLFLSFILITINIVLYIFAQESFIKIAGLRVHSFASHALLPSLVMTVIFIVLFVLTGAGVFKSLRCPKCRRFFPKGKLEKYTSYEGTDIGISSGGDSYFRSSTTHVYWTECKYCGHIIWVLK